MSFTTKARTLLTIAWGEALKALRTNLVPGLILQTLMLVLGAAYLWHPATRHFFGELSELKSRWGLLFSFAGTSLASTLLPEILGLLLPHAAQGRNGGPGLAPRLLFGLIFWGLIGMQVDLFYRLQFHLFGPSDHISTIATKVLVDAFVYCPLLAIPQAVCIFLWRDHNFTHRGFHGWTPLRFYALKIFPVLMANWMVWIPLICIIYSLPPALGIPFFIIAQSFWVMVFTTLSAGRHPEVSGH